MTTETPETLTSLIQATKGRRSYADLGEESGPGLGKARWTQLGGAHPLLAVPGFETVKTIARVLRVSERRVWLAIGREGGVDVSGESPLMDRMVARTDALTENQVDILIEVIAEWVDLQLSLNELKAAAEEAAVKPVRHLKAARKTTGTEARGPRGGAKKR